MYRIHKDDTYPIPMCMLVGYGREQIRRFVCYRCGSEFFNERMFDIDGLLLCDECINLESDYSISVQSDSVPYIKIINWRQEVSTYKKRSIYNYKKVARRDNYTCQYCGYSPRLFVDFLPMHVDHIIPVSHGGGNSMINLVMSCAYCNMHLGSKIFKDFHSKKVYIIELCKKERRAYTEDGWKNLVSV